MKKILAREWLHYIALVPLCFVGTTVTLLATGSNPTEAFTVGAFGGFAWAVPAYLAIGLVRMTVAAVRVIRLTRSTAENEAGK